MKLDGCTTLITGASAGIGRELARQLAGRVHSLVIVARRRARLEELRDELRQRHPNSKVTVRVVDLSKREQLDDLGDWLEQEKIAIDFLINNAGLGDRGPFAISDLARVEAMLQVNLAALTLLTHRLLPEMIARGRGAILNVSSSASFLPMPTFAVYAASKAYVTSFSEGLRAELRGSGVSVTSLCPGPVHTEFDSVARRANASAESAPEFTYVPVETVARAALEAVEGDRALVIPGLAMKLGMALVRLLPLPVLRFAFKFSR